MTSRALTLATVSPNSQPTEETWEEFLTTRIDEQWRPSEYDHARQLFRPDPDNPETRIYRCSRAACWNLMSQRALCPGCKKDLRLALADDPTLNRDDWLRTPRVRTIEYHCLVRDCPRSRVAHALCLRHANSFRRARATRAPAEFGVEDWMRALRPKALPPLPTCPMTGCWRTSESEKTSLCGTHGQQFYEWRKTLQRDQQEDAVAKFIAREREPLLDEATRLTHAAALATPFGQLPEPLNRELLFVTQQRDKNERAKLDARQLRAVYLRLRQEPPRTLVGLDGLGIVDDGSQSNYKAMCREWQRIIDTAHREWSGIDNRDPKLVYFSDLTINRSSKHFGDQAAVDLREIEQDWLVQSIKEWLHHASRVKQSCYNMAASWTTASEILAVRRTPRHALGSADMDAIVTALRERYPREKTQARAIAMIDDLVTFARTHEPLADIWETLPARFTIDPARHRAIGQPSAAPEASADEPFRFIPQPIMDWLMDHLHLLSFSDAYATAEARALLFVLERCGRRPGETVSLKEECISYDSAGAPYLEWQRGKPPYTMGSRLPIHQETHDVIRDWQRIKREAGVTSQWLFPSRAYVRSDRRYADGFIATRVNQLVAAVLEQAPYEQTVEGADGNLIYFNMTTIDPYAFRHAFAQRLADATDADGNSTTPPDVLQDFMGHKSFNTTMAYYEVTARRRQKALRAIPARALNLHGEAVLIDREREGFTKIAVTAGHCTEPQNVAAGGHDCMLEHACESCPFFLVDPLERDSMHAKRHHLMVKIERARVIQSPQHILDHYDARIQDVTAIIEGIDTYIDELPDDERGQIKEALDKMADIRRRATAPRRIDLRRILSERTPFEQ